MSTYPISTFNAGREYTAEGQRIAFTQIQAHDEHGFAWIAFVDIDRNVDGIMEVAGNVGFGDDCDFVIRERDVMTVYDLGGYSPFRWTDRDQGLYDRLHAFALANAPTLKR